MNLNRSHVAAVLAMAVLLVAQPSSAQPRPPEGDRDRAKEAIRSLVEKMPWEKRRLLSAGAHNLIQWARAGVVEERGGREREGSAPAAGPAGILRPETPGGGGRDRIPRVSDPRTDFTRSIVGGFTQSETSTAWCGRNVVVGFNDSGSILETREGNGGLSFVGYSLSEDAGNSFTDRGFLNPGPDFSTFLGGDPVVVCSSADTFHFASLYSAFTETALLSGITVSTSSDGGANFGDPVVAAAKNAFDHVQDKGWLAVDPGNPNNLYVTYSDFGNFDISPTCPADFSVSIELVRSTDVGLTWSAPVVLDELCGFFAFVQGSQVVVGPAGEVNVAWERSQDGEHREQAFRRSTDGGATFGPLVKVSDVTCAGTCFAFQGGFRSGMEFPSLAVDRSNRSSRGALYLAWHDGRNNKKPDADGLLGFYGYADILVSRSTDGGATWSAPATTNRDRRRRNTDQYQPGIAVDNLGRVGLCYYDRSLDDDNFRITRTCAVSRDAGRSWDRERITRDGFAPFHGTDVLVDPRYMGDYDSLAGDTLLGKSGFVGGFLTMSPQGNQDVLANQLE